MAVMRDMNRADDYLQMLVDKREQFDYKSSRWMSVDDDIQAVEEFVEWMIDNGFEKDENDETVQLL